MTGDSSPIDIDEWEKVRATLFDSEEHEAAKEALTGLVPFHFPCAFPEVFLRERSGFDVVLGNPPWDKVRFEAQQFWVARSPGLNSLPADRRDTAIKGLRRQQPMDAHLEIQEAELRERLQKFIDRAYALQGRGRHGHHDFAKVFAERAMRILAPSGCLGYVLPRTSLVLGGWTDIRRELLQSCLVMMAQTSNRAGWMFEDVHGQIKVALVTRRSSKGPGEAPSVRIWPAIRSKEQLSAVCDDNSICLHHDEIETLSDSAVVPWFSAPQDKPLFDRLRGYPRLRGGHAWIQAVADSSRWDFSGSGPHKKYVHTTDPGRGWRVLMTRHVGAFTIADEIEFRRFIPEPVALVDEALGVVRRGRGAVVGSEHPVIVFRYPTRNDDTRTLIATALPETGYIYSKGYVHGLLTTHESITDVLALLGYLNTFLCDWWVRRFTDRHMTLPVLANVPLPGWSPADRISVAELASPLLVRGGTERLPGGYEIMESSASQKLGRTDLLAAIESHALEGFGLGSESLEAVLNDFTDNAIPESFVAKVEGAWRQT